VRLALLAAVIALGAVAAGSTAVALDAKGCAWGAVAADNACLIDGHACKAQRTALYRRHGFACRAGVLAYDWSQLRRRQVVGQTLAPGSPCPVSERTGELTRVGLQPGFIAWGPGPAWPVLGGLTSLDVPFEFASAGPEYVDWGVRKAMWGIDSRYVGPTLVRGHQLDGPDEVRFENGSPGFTEEKRLHPESELRFIGGYVRPAVTRVRTLGCYAYQVDGIGFSRTIVFHAVAR
jgi:hypothetical protein